MANSVIVWFRQDLRLADNPALKAALETGLPIVPVYILDDGSAEEWRMGAASRVWLHHSLSSLSASLQGGLKLFKGDAQTLLPAIAKESGASRVFWNRCYEPWRIKRDARIKEKSGLICHSENGSLLWEPWDIKKSDGTPYRVFTPFFRKGCLAAQSPRAPLHAPTRIELAAKDHKFAAECTLNELRLLPENPRWDTPMLPHWDIGEAGAHNRLTHFLSHGLKGYKDGRNYPAQPHTSRLAPHLHFGEISPNQLWYAAIDAGLESKAELDLDCFHSELAWREFSHSLLYYNPDLPEQPLNKKFLSFDWESVDFETLERWQKGQTGFPIVDAGMRELWATGYMHNRVRMIVASFLVKDLRYHWRVGEDWFWDTLFDADLANNAASWQWVAGCGADAAPYFRIFNPTTQGEKFDPFGKYIKQWAPDSYKIKPMVDHATARDKALGVFKSLHSP